MSLRKIRLELARTRSFPDGSSSRGYEFLAPLTDDGHLDVEEWKGLRKRCKVRRFWPGEEDRVGELHHTRHRTWAFSYAPGEEDDEAFFHLESHLFKVDEYVSITEQDGETLPFRVVAIT